MFRPKNKKELSKKIKDIVNGGNIPESWNLSAITDYSSLFSEIEDFSRLTFIQNWNVSRARNMELMFQGCINFNIPLNNWDVSNVRNMTSMFEGCTNFNQPLNDWDVSDVEDMTGMFDGCSNFNQPLDKWDISNVEYMSGMFENCINFNQPLNDWHISNDADYTDIFLNSGMLQDNMPELLQPHMSQAERRRRQLQSNQIEEQMKRARETPIDEIKEQPFPKCIICGDYLNNNDGPGPSSKCQQDNCNDVINVCKNNHLFHRGCILNWCNAERVDSVSQMSIRAPYQHLQEQQKKIECPSCTHPLIPNCEGLRNKERVPTEQINKDLLINKGGKRKRKTLGKRKTQCKKKTMKGKKSRKTKRIKH